LLLNYSTGEVISDEIIVANTSEDQFLSHDTIFDVEVWSGLGKTGTQLVSGTDYSLVLPDSFNSVYNGIRFITNNGNSFYITYKTKGDYVDADDVNSKADKVVGATNGNFAGLNASGNLIDSTSKASDFATSGHAHSAATTAVAGFMSAVDKTKLDGIAESANNYTHPNHSGDVTSVGDGATTIANDAVTNAKMANMVANSLKGNATADSADPSDISIAANKFPARASTGNLEAKSISDFGLGLVAAADAAAGRSALGALGSANITQTISNGVTDKAPSEDAVYDALALKAPLASPTFTGTATAPILIAPIIKPSADSTTAMQFMKANGTTPIIKIDTSNMRIGFGVAPSEKMHLFEDNTRNVFQIGSYGCVGSIYSSGDYVFGNNCKPAPYGTMALHYMVTHATYGARALVLSLNNGIQFFAQRASVVAGNVFSEEKMRLTNDGNLKLYTGYVELNEISAPSAGAADSLRAYAVDNGGLTELHVRAYGEAAQKVPLCARENSYSKTQGFAIVDNGNSGTSKTIDWTAGNKQKMTLTGNCEVSFTDPSGSAPLELRLIQDTTGGRTVTWSGMTIKWEGGIAATLTAASNAIDIVEFTYDSGEDTYYGSCKNDFKASA